MSEDTSSNLQVLTAQIVSAHVSTSSISSDEISNLIRTVYDALANAGKSDGAGHTHTHGHAHSHTVHPAVPIEESIFPDWIICLEDGKKLKTLKRHLASSFGMTVDEYRTKWGLPPTYPMTAPNYAAQRSTMAKSIGLGRRAAEPDPEPVVVKAPGRKAKVAKKKTKARS
jgi:predicted transcriptional regulator